MKGRREDLTEIETERGERFGGRGRTLVGRLHAMKPILNPSSYVPRRQQGEKDPAESTSWFSTGSTGDKEEKVVVEEEPFLGRGFRLRVDVKCLY